MKSRYFCLLLCALLINSCNDNNDDTERSAKSDNISINAIDTPEDLLRKIYSLASQEKYEEINKLIFASNIKDDGKVHDLRKEIVEGIKEAKFHGDNAYSNEALHLIISEHLHRIKPIPKDLLKQLFLNENSFGQDQTLKQIAQQAPEKIQIFDYKDVHIMMVEVSGEYKLIFWEDLNNILP